MTGCLSGLSLLLFLLQFKLPDTHNKMVEVDKTAFICNIGPSADSQICPLIKGHNSSKQSFALPLSKEIDGFLLL